ncbi:hypothetical protein ABW21_db0207032 [Orbilia brochopaga]|nr:hypothetical protein ABW21_db0207032 [Drechslerella brochopaga]
MVQKTTVYRLLRLLFLLGTTLAAEESRLNEYTDINCKKSALKLQQVGTPDGVCQGVTTKNTTAVAVGSVGHGCAITVYTDQFCSDDATEIYEGDCVSIGAFWLSFSVDGCTPNPPTSVSTRVVPLSTSSTRRPPSSSTSISSPEPTDTDRTNTNFDATAPATSSSAAAVASSSSGLSHGAVAGIAVGCTIAGILVIAAFVWFCFIPSRRRPSPPVAPDERADDEAADKRFWFFGKSRRPSYANFPPPPAELSGSYPDVAGAATRNPVFELSGAEMGELSAAPGSPTELKAQVPIYPAPPVEQPSTTEKSATG